MSPEEVLEFARKGLHNNAIIENDNTFKVQLIETFIDFYDIPFIFSLE